MVLCACLTCFSFPLLCAVQFQIQAPVATTNPEKKSFSDKTRVYLFIIHCETEDVLLMEPTVTQLNLRALELLRDTFVVFCF